MAGDGASTKESDTADSNSKSYFQKTVCLRDWWLVKSDKASGEKLAVAGFDSREKQAVRVFSSAPILRRYDVFTLETVDKICIIMKGFLNKARTEENGFPSEVCNHFVFGFPPYWEVFARDRCGGEPVYTDAAPGITDLRSLSQQAGRVPEASDIESCSRDTLHENMRIFEWSEKSPADSARLPLAPSGLKENYVPPSEHNNVTGHQKDNHHISPRVLRNTRARYLSSLPGTELQDFADELIPRTPDSRSTEDVSGEKNRICYSDDSLKGDQSYRSFSKKVSESNKVQLPSCGSGDVAGNRRNKNTGASEQNISQRTNRCGKVETRASWKKKDESTVLSPESLSLKRSRSGRLLLPPLEFWRNQSSVYDEDGRIIGIKDLQVNQPTSGSKSDPQRKKRQLQ